MSPTSLERARSIEKPTREAMLQRSPSVQYFWDQNKNLFKDAWEDWEREGDVQNLVLDRSLFSPNLREAVEKAWKNPDQEIAVEQLWEEVFPGVFKTQFFDPERLPLLRDYLDRVADADIPLRPPYGIVLNRGGAMLDPRSEGYLAAPNFQAFYRDLMDAYMRPISRLLFPDTIGYDTQTFGFSIRWQANKDTSLRPHADASAVTLNINLNLPEEDYSGSAVRFFDHDTGKVDSLKFEPGTALIHRGNVVHASEPITDGERYNFVLWLYGDRGQVPQDLISTSKAPPEERWTIPSARSDGFSPF